MDELTPSDLHDSADMFTLFFERAAGGLAIIELKGICQRMNPAFCRLFGYKKGEIVGR